LPRSNEKAARVAPVPKIRSQCFQTLEEGVQNKSIIAMPRNASAALFDMQRPTVIEEAGERGPALEAAPDRLGDLVARKWFERCRLARRPLPGHLPRERIASGSNTQLDN
jgi:hypothetical protein